MTFRHELSRRTAALCTAAVAGVILLIGGCEHSNLNSPVAASARAAQLVVSPKAVSTPPDRDVTFTAVGLTAEGDTADVTVTWSASGGTVRDGGASSNGRRHYGRYVNGACGVSSVWATAPGDLADTATVTVTCSAVPVAAVEVSPPSATLEVGQTVELTATPRSADGTALNGRTVAWESSNPGVARVSASGLVAGVAAGSATITATTEGKSGTAAVTVTAPSPGGAAVLVGAGDIADCDAEATAALLDKIAGTVFTAGDNAYPDGSDSDYADCYAPSWGRHRARTRPSPGNHDYHTRGGAGYYAYFGTSAGPAGRGYYSYDLGAWHIVSLNSNADMSAGSAQEQWLRADLAASAKGCTIAYWHHPRFSSGPHGSDDMSQGVWQALYDAGADIVISGHDHDYERFAPQTPAGAADPVRGIREFVVGTGGASHYSIGSTEPNSEAHNDDTFGVLKLTLGAGTYTWEFVPVAGGSYRDSGSGTCH